MTVEPYFIKVKKEFGLDEKAIIERIKFVRQHKKITLKDLSKRSGLTEGYLSRIENSDTAPPFSTLSRIAQALGIDISYLLFPENRESNENPNIVVMKRADIESGSFSGSPHGRPVHGYQFEPLATKKHGKNMQPYILVPDFEPGEFLQHEGEEFFYVLEGRIEFLYGIEKFELVQGDCVYFDSQISHTGRSLGDQKARILIILHPYKRI